MTETITRTDEVEAQLPDAVTAGWECEITEGERHVYVHVHEAEDKSTAYAIGAMQEAGWEVVCVDFDDRLVSFFQPDA